MAKTVEVTVNDVDFGNVFAYGRYDFKAEASASSAHVTFHDPYSGKEEGCIFVMDDQAAEELERLMGSVKEAMRAQQVQDLYGRNQLTPDETEARPAGSFSGAPTF